MMSLFFYQNPYNILFLLNLTAIHIMSFTLWTDELCWFLCACTCQDMQYFQLKYLHMGIFMLDYSTTASLESMLKFRVGFLAKKLLKSII